MHMAKPNSQKWHKPSSRKLSSLFFFFFISISFTLIGNVAGLHDQTPRIWGGNNKHQAFSKMNTLSSNHDSSRTKRQVEAIKTSTKFIKIKGIPTPVLQNSRLSIQKNGDSKIPKKESMKPHPPQIIIIGGPASGKGTQCEKIAERYGVVHLSTGDMLREAVKAGTDVGRIAKGYMERGELVPDEVIIAIVDARLKEKDCVERGWLLDGFPRTKAQAEHLASMGIHADITLLLEVDDEELVERVVGRRMDPVTGKIYHLKFRPPPPEIEGRLEHRSDDTYESIGMRLKQFHSNLSQIKSYLEDSIVMVDGHGSPDLVAKRIAKSVDHELKQLIQLS